MRGKHLTIFFLLVILLCGKGMAENKNMRIYVVSTATNFKILPDTTFILSGIISDAISIVACRGEYEPASFVIKPSADINSLMVEVTDLAGEKDIIPHQNVDIRTVKCWYQSGAGKLNENQKLLTPELLLKDDSLVKADYENKANYVKLTYPGEEAKYICISNKEDIFSQYGSKIPTGVFPIKDSKIFLPVNIKTGENKQFWVTVNVPENIAPGIYRGKIELKNQGVILRSLDLTVKVLPFELASPRTCYDLNKEFTSSIYYLGTLHPDWPKGSIYSGYKSDEQLRNEFKNMFAHGVTNPSCYQGHRDSRSFGEYLKIKEETGMGKQPLYYLGTGTGNSNAPEDMEKLKDRVKNVITFAKLYDIPEVYIYGKDEAQGEALKSQRLAWQTTREAGGKVFVAGYAGVFEAMGDLLNLLVWAGTPLAEEADKWHKVGHKIFSYANPHAGLEEPETYRRNYGLLLWKSNYDGAMDFAYQTSYGNLWNDYDHTYRGGFCSHTYPTADGVIDTISWELYREGIDDIRYATTLKMEIEKAGKKGDGSKKKIASEAEDYLRTLDPGRKTDVIRQEIIDYILRLTADN